MRLIDADALLELDWDVPYSSRVANIVSAPTVDAVEVVKQAFSGEMKLMPAEDVLTMDRPQGEWIPCRERLPKDLEVVNITWINHRPMTYYADIKDKPFTATAIHYKDKWWWYSPICEDMLAEYGKSECDKMDADIEVTAWMALPEPWKGDR